MRDSALFWLQCRAAALPYRPTSLDAPASPLQAMIDCGADAQPLLWRLEWQRLDQAERRWLEGGEYLPAICTLWLERAAALMRFGAQQRLSVAILEVAARRLTQLSISDLLHVMAGDAWQGDGQVALVWGFGHEALVSTSALAWPLACRGAVFPATDGLDVGWWATPADIGQI
jgi:hypothetical protein